MRTLLATLSVSVLVGACVDYGPPPPGPGPGPGPGPRPEVRFIGTVIDKSGPCNIVRARNGRRFAVNVGDLQGIPRGATVRVQGRITPRQPCPGATRIRVQALQPIAGPRPGPGPGPGGIVFVGRVIEKAGRCHTIRAANGRRFAVDRGVLAGIPVGARVRIRAVRAQRQYCPGALRVQVRRLQRV